MTTDHTTTAQAPGENRRSASCGMGDEAREHFRQAGLEFLKGVKRLVDDGIERMSKGETKGTRIVVE